MTVDKSKVFYLCLILGVLSISLFLPWQSVVSNGTGDELYQYTFLTYGWIWSPPAAPASSFAENISVRPDSLIIFAELAVLAGFAWFLHPTALRVARGIVGKTIISLVFIAIMFTATVLSMTLLAKRLGDANLWTTHTYQVLDELKEFRTGLFLFSENTKVSVITANNVSAASFQYGKEHFLNAKTLTADNSKQQRKCKDIVQIIDVMTSQNRFAAAAAETKKLQSLITAMEVNERNLLQQRINSLKETQSEIWLAVGALVVTILASLIWLGILIKRSIDLLQTEIRSRTLAEEKLILSAANLQRSNEELQQFAYVASHDLQEPLRAVTGFLTLLRKQYAGNLDDTANKYIGFAIDGSQRMSQLITDLLKFARIETKGQVFEPVDLNKILKDIEIDLGEQIAESGTLIDCPQKLPEVTGDHVQLRQLFQNLLSNAMKFRGEQPPRIVMTFEKESQVFKFIVSDNGRGFDMAHAERIFVIFQRLQTRDKAEGTGIGLALCKKIVERHGGKIWAESSPGQGASFIFTLPVR